MKNAGYEAKKIISKVGEVVSIKKSIGDINTGDQGIIIAIESERPYPYIVKVKDTEVFAKLDDFQLI